MRRQMDSPSIPYPRIWDLDESQKTHQFSISTPVEHPFQPLLLKERAVERSPMPASGGHPEALITCARFFI